MYKVVINTCRHGGFNLFRAAKLWLKYYRGVTDPETLSRHDARLVKCIEILGDLASGEHAELEVRIINSDKYCICNYDGYESIQTPESMHWIEIII